MQLRRDRMIEKAAEARMFAMRSSSLFIIPTTSMPIGSPSLVRATVVYRRKRCDSRTGPVGRGQYVDGQRRPLMKVLHDARLPAERASHVPCHRAFEF